jgi:hypothetical protein
MKYIVILVVSFIGFILLLPVCTAPKYTVVLTPKEECVYKCSQCEERCDSFECKSECWEKQNKCCIKQGGKVAFMECECEAK